ncbi:MAG: DUF3168 domain-containing protein [Phycisphaerales bacterium]
MIVGTDAEALVSAHLRASVAIQALIGERVYTEVPKRAEWPLLRLQRIGGGPVASPAVLDGARLQFDAFGGSKAQARELAATVVAELDANLAGVHAAYASTVTATRAGTLRYSPDTTFDPPKPRYLVDVTVYVRPNP